jgi:hypothetical protein
VFVEEIADRFAPEGASTGVVILLFVLFQATVGVLINCVFALAIVSVIVAIVFWRMKPPVVGNGALA